MKNLSLMEVIGEIKDTLEEVEMFGKIHHRYNY